MQLWLEFSNSILGVVENRFAFKKLFEASDRVNK